MTQFSRVGLSSLVLLGVFNLPAQANHAPAQARSGALTFVGNTNVSPATRVALRIGGTDNDYYYTNNNDKKYIRYALNMSVTDPNNNNVSKFAASGIYEAYAGPPIRGRDCSQFDPNCESPNVTKYLYLEWLDHVNGKLEFHRELHDRLVSYPRTAQATVSFEALGNGQWQPRAVISGQTKNLHTINLGGSVAFGIFGALGASGYMNTTKVKGANSQALTTFDQMTYTRNGVADAPPDLSNNGTNWTPSESDCNAHNQNNYYRVVGRTGFTAKFFPN